MNAIEPSEIRVSGGIWSLAFLNSSYATPWGTTIQWLGGMRWKCIDSREGEEGVHTATFKRNTPRLERIRTTSVLAVDQTHEF